MSISQFTARAPSSIAALSAALGGLRPGPGAIATWRPWPERAWLALRASWQAQRLRARQQRQRRVLQGLDRRVLRDIGLADQVPDVTGVDWSVLERARW